MRLLIAACSMALLAGCVPETDMSRDASAGQCARVVIEGGDRTAEAPPRDHGGGMVGVPTEITRADGSRASRFSLIDCRAGEVARVDMPGETDLAGRIEDLRRASALTSTRTLVQAAQSRGLPVQRGPVDLKAGTRARCACDAWYPDLMAGR